MKYKLIFIFALLLVTIPLVSSQEIFKQNEETNIIKSIRVDGGLANNLLCNITVQNPDKVIIVDFQPMQDRTSYFNYTFPANNLTELGEYKYDVSCTNSIINETGSFTFEVTPSGKRFDTADSITFGIILGIIFLISIFFLYLARQSESDGVRLFFMMTSFAFVILTAGAGRIMVDYLPISGGINGIVTSFLFILALVFVLIMYYVFVNQTRRSIELMRIKKGFGDITDSENF